MQDRNGTITYVSVTRCEAVRDAEIYYRRSANYFGEDASHASFSQQENYETSEFFFVETHT